MGIFSKIKDFFVFGYDSNSKTFGNQYVNEKLRAKYIKVANLMNIIFDSATPIQLLSIQTFIYSIHKDDYSEFLCKNKFTEIDTIIFTWFTLTSTCIPEIRNDKNASIAYEEYINNLQLAVTKEYAISDSEVSKIFDDRFELYNRFDSMNDIVYEFKNIILSDFCDNKISYFAGGAPLKILGLDYDIRCQSEIIGFYRSFPEVYNNCCINVINYYNNFK